MIGRSMNLRKLDSLRYGWRSARSIPKDFCKRPKLGTLIASGVEVHHPIPTRQSKQPFEPMGCRR
jgi:hypothetical protein